jgi:membrane protein
VKNILQSKPYLWLRSILDFLSAMKISTHSAYTSFFLILSVFPALMILVGVLGYTTVDVEDVLELIGQVLPQPLMPYAQRLLHGAYEATSAPLISLSAVTAIWSASRGILGLKEGLNAVYAVKERRSYLVTRGICMFYTVLFVAMLVLTLVLHVFGRTILDYLHMTTNPLLLFLMDVIDFRFFLLLLLQTALFTAMYAALPDRKMGLWESFPGAVLASLGWLAFSDLFSLYVEYFPRYANIFGSVYAAALSMLWLYCCISIVFYGAAVNRYIMEKRTKKS